MTICGAMTKSGRQCQKEVRIAGTRCHLHLHRRGQPQGRSLFDKALRICGYIADIAGTAGGVAWIYQVAEPHIQPLLNAGLFSPERFWFHAVRDTRGESPQVVARALRKAINDVRSRQDHALGTLSRYSNEQRQRISSAYDAILRGVRKDYPSLIPREAP